MTTRDIMGAVHQNFRLDDGHQAGLLGQRGIAGQGMGVGGNAGVAGDALADGDHRAPFGKTRSDFAVFVHTFAQAVQALGYFFAGRTRQVLGASVDLDARDHILAADYIDQRRTVGGLLVDGFVIEYYAADEFPQSLGAEQ